jgi:hypothetical protein
MLFDQCIRRVDPLEAFLGAPLQRWICCVTIRMPDLQQILVRIANVVLRCPGLDLQNCICVVELHFGALR